MSDVRYQRSGGLEILSIVKSLFWIRLPYLCAVQEFFFTILSIWVIWKLFSAFSNSGNSARANQFTQTNHNHFHQKREGEVKIEETQPKKKSRSADDDDYVDYEEIK